jgi:hypothetical protein
MLYTEKKILFFNFSFIYEYRGIIPGGEAAQE